MIDEKIYTQEDLNNAVSNAIKEMTIVLERKDEEIEILKRRLLENEDEKS